MSIPESEPEQEQEEEETFSRALGARRVFHFEDPFGFIQENVSCWTSDSFMEMMNLCSLPLRSLPSRLTDSKSPKRDELEEAQIAFRDHGLGHGSRSERKNRKAVLKLGMHPVPNIHRVTMKKSENILYIIGQPEVYHSPATDTHVILGQGEFKDLRNETRQSVAEEFAIQSEAEASEMKDDPVVEEDESDVDEEGLDAKDIELVMNQADVSRARAVRALKKCDQDLVSAIMELTMN